jgi:hypothetical protein
MSKPININKPGEENNLKARRFRIYILGGFGVSLGRFSISFKHKKTNYIVSVHKVCEIQKIECFCLSTHPFAPPRRGILGIQFFLIY